MNPEGAAMNRTTAALAAALSAGILGISTAVADAAIHRADGSARISIPRESVTFSAVEHSDGTSSGFADVRDTSAGVTAHIRVDCLNVFGATAIISGIVTRSNSAVLVGFRGLFEVVDADDAANGGGDAGEEGEEGEEGQGHKGPPDLMSPVNFYDPGVGVDCKVP